MGFEMCHHQAIKLTCPQCKNAPQDWGGGGGRSYDDDDEGTEKRVVDLGGILDRVESSVARQTFRDGLNEGNIQRKVVEAS